MDENITVITNFNRLCRTCLIEKPEEDLQSVFANSIDRMLSDVADIKVLVNDGLPSFMCKDCELQLGLAHSFKEQCQKTNAQLKELLLSQFNIDNKPYVININNTELHVKNHEPLLMNDIFNDSDITDELPKDGRLSCADLDINDNYSDEELKPKIDGNNTRNGKVKHECTECGKTFRLESSLKTHSLKHGKKLSCEVCGKNLTIFSFTGERPYSCDQCPKKYHTSSNLSAHKKTHLGIRDHVCSICGKAFGDSRTLKCHTRTHTGEKPYICHVCGSRYTQSGQLAAHRKTHRLSIETTA
ncbi:zinc finger protein [Holotrichia oblita]|uniref:Zinc finger protein n=1 Tax=Holotrichia oblita TaxID=644536 RepID=A0ACB9T4P2_HOLOL|nr:zinc finger protein [Holotrichia oblita]